MSMQAVLQVEAALFRSQAPDLLLRPGATFAARVMDRHGQHGLLNFAGVPILAELPDSVKTGDKLRLLVQETRGEKVLMKLVQDQPAGPPPQVGLPLPGGDGALISVDPDGSQAQDGDREGETASIAIGYESPNLGKLSFRISLAPGAVSVHAEVPGGATHELADDASDALRIRLERVTGRSAGVVVVPRRESFDAYA